MEDIWWVSRGGPEVSEYDFYLVFTFSEFSEKLELSKKKKNFNKISDCLTRRRCAQHGGRREG